MTWKPFHAKNSTKAFLSTGIYEYVHRVTMWSDKVNAIPQEGISMPPMDFSLGISWNVAGSVVGSEWTWEAEKLTEEGMGVGNDLGAELQIAY